MRTLVPADSLVYLETNDLAAALRPIVDDPLFAKTAKAKPDISGLQGIQLAVSVSGFEMSEEKLTDDYSVGRVQPRFVAIADTHAWNWGAVAFTESQIGSFVMDVYHSDVAQEKAEKHGGTFFTWSATDGRKAFALVKGSLVYFGNDESAIEKCLAVNRGEGDDLAKTGNLPVTDPVHIASGYVSTDGIAQLANLAAISMASETDGDPDAQSAIAGILPQLVRGAVLQLTWTSSKIEAGVEDRYTAVSPDPVAAVLAETLAPSGEAETELFDMIPREIPVMTVYDLEKPHVAWRSVLLTSQSLLDPVTGRLIADFSTVFTAPYGVDDPELFLSGVSPRILTGNTDPAGDSPFVIARVAIPANVRSGISDSLKADKDLSAQYGFEILRSEEGGFAAAFLNGIVIVGDADAVMVCLKARAENRVVGRESEQTNRFDPGPSATTLSIDVDTAMRLAAVLSEPVGNGGNTNSLVETETRFTRRGIERRTISNFGLIGSIIANLATDR